jgi:hypothetical protein
MQTEQSRTEGIERKVRELLRSSEGIAKLLLTRDVLEDERSFSTAAVEFGLPSPRNRVDMIGVALSG